MNKLPVVLGFDPGKDKCGIALMGYDRTLLNHQVVPTQEVISLVRSYLEKFAIQAIILGDQTTSKQWQTRLEHQLSPCPPLVLVDERYTSLEARERYWQMYPPQGLTRLLPQGMRYPPRSIDDIVAILLIERYWTRSEGNPQG